MNPLLTLLFLLYACGTVHSQACSSSSECSSGDLCYTVTQTSTSTACTYSTSSSSPALVPYQECLPQGSDTDTTITDDGCTATLTDTISCEEDQDCSSDTTGSTGDCCISQTCYDDSGNSATNYICGQALYQGDSKVLKNGCYYGSCQSDNYYPLNFPCSQTADCTSLYSFTGYCCASLSCNGQSNSDSYCVPSSDGLSQSIIYNGYNCSSLCLDPNDAQCMAQDPSSDEPSQCSVYNDSEGNYCCAVIFDADGSYPSGESGYCDIASNLKQAIDLNDGKYISCLAQIGKAALAFLVAFI